MKRALIYSVAVSLSLGLCGCGASSEREPTTQTSSPAAADTHGEHADHVQGHHSDDAQAGPSDMEKMKSELAKLSPEDAASAEKQHICPVSGDMLGAMGAPIKVDVNGQQVWICCEGCREQLLENPDDFLAKLKN